MLLVISPAKTLDDSGLLNEHHTQYISKRRQGGKGEHAMSIDDSVIGERDPKLTQPELERRRVYTEPALLENAQQLIEITKKLTPAQIASLMKISDNLAILNAARFNSWQRPFTLDNARQAILMFKGDVYAGLQADIFHPRDMQFAQRHLRILSGLYGVLRPLDLIQAYRLEMSIKLTNARGSDLYHFWGDLITDEINSALEAQGDNILVDLASNEYFHAIKLEKLKGRVIKPIFLDEKKGQFKVIGIHAKRARGLMSRFIITHQITQPEDLTQFTLEGYRFDASRSSDNELIFKRYEQ
jgi:uncharacterized protein